jgi:1-deoxy-D-xylulose-5-phosphate reductoisomerase
MNSDNLSTTPAASAPQRVTLLGSTGSIGDSTLDVLALHPERYEVFALTGFSRMERLAAQCERFRPARVVVPDDARRQDLLGRLTEDLRRRIDVAVGAQALCEVASDSAVDQVMAAIVGAAGLAPSLAAAQAGKRLLLANKEALVVGGQLFMDSVHQGGGSLLPIDSEHSAIFQCLPLDRRTWDRFIDHIVLTASGGPFRQREIATFGDITPAEAVAHPNWRMGQKISVDSATMMNKALEVIEARWLFDLPPERIQTLLHPQSIIHSMVVCRDASVMAQLGTPDMKVPIAYGLSYPERIHSGAPRLDFLKLRDLTFEVVDPVRFPGLQLAYDALKATEGTTAVLNAANEVAVAAFLDGKLSFTGIHQLNVATCERLVGQWNRLSSLDDLLALDALARRVAGEILQARQP